MTEGHPGGAWETPKSGGLDDFCVARILVFGLFFTAGGFLIVLLTGNAMGVVGGHVAKAAATTTRVAPLVATGVRGGADLSAGADGAEGGMRRPAMERSTSAASLGVKTGAI